MRISKAMAAAAIALVALFGAGCASQGSNPHTHSIPTATQQAQTKPPGINLVAGKAGLSVTSYDVSTLFTYDEAIAIDAHGHQYDVATFANDTARDNWIKVASDMGSLLYAKGHQWAILDMGA